MTLTIDDIVDEDGAMTLRLGDPPAPVPEPFATLVRRLLAQRPADSTSHWLFPGRRPGQPLNYVSHSQGLRDLGVPLRLARVAAIRQLALQAPTRVAVVIAVQIVGPPNRREPRIALSACSRPEHEAHPESCRADRPAKKGR